MCIAQFGMMLVTVDYDPLAILARSKELKQQLAVGHFVVITETEFSVFVWVVMT